MQDYEKLGVFYLGREYDLSANKPKEDLVLYDSKDLTTHALCVGMTGSGKTGLCLALLEEAAIDGIPAIIIDPKGDLGNLLLTFPQLRPEDFAPYIDPAEATRAGRTPEEQAKIVAAEWKQGLADWGQSPERIARLREAADVAIYTPGSNAGLPLTVLRSFAAPPQSTRDNPEAFRETVSAAAASLLGLLGIEADPLKSREQILISSILEKTWRDGKDLDIAGLIRAIQTPGFDKVGVMDLESFFPAKERFELSMQLNNLLASPGFSAWLEGESLDIQRLLYTPAGKPRLSILSIAHLSDAERMFFVTILLSETISWMRNQSGTSSLRALLYMDEVFGYFPPSKNPPSKTPMLTLLKQARAFGLGVVLATQNPVDLDYKGLANCGTWLLGRLQTERDKMRVLDGLEGASTQAGATFDRAKMEQILSGLGKRVFLMNNVHEDQPIVFQSRWALSYLRGPLTREQISSLMQERKGASSAGGTPTSLRGRDSGPSSQNRPVLPPDIAEKFLPLRAPIPAGGKLVYRPAVLGLAKVHFAQTTTGVDVWKSLSLIAPIDAEVPPDVWTTAEVAEDDAPELESAPFGTANFASLAADLSRPKKYSELATALKDHLYRSQKCQLWKCAALKQVSQAGESEADFRIRLSQTGRETRDGQLEKLRQKYAPKITSITEQIRKAEVRVEKEKSQSTQQMLGTALSFGSTILSALMGRKLTSASNINKASSAMKSAGRAFREQQDVSQAGETVEAYKERLANLDAEFKAEAEKIQTGFDADQLQLEEVAVQPKKADISVSQVLLLWEPWVQSPDGATKRGA